MKRSFFVWGLMLALGLVRPADAAPVKVASWTIRGVPVRVATVDLADPATLVTIGLAGQGDLLEPPTPPHGEEPFGAMVARWPAALCANGTFFSMGPERPVMGTLIAGGKLANHVSWKPVGTAFGLAMGNRPELAPAAGAPWRRWWTSLAAGPRLLPFGDARSEGIHDPDVLGSATRTALGIDAKHSRLFVVSMGAPVGLAGASRLMHEIGAVEAVNLDGGTSRGLAVDGRIEVTPGRPLTNVLLVFDSRHPAPAPVMAAYRRFRGVAAGPGPLVVGGRRFDVGPFGAGRVTPLRVIRPGRPYNFEDWDFTSRGAPLVRNTDGWLDLRAAGGAAIGAVPPHAKFAGNWRFRCLVMVGRRAARLTFDGTPLVLQGETAPRLGTVTAPWRVASGRHLLEVAARGQRLEARLDGRAIASPRAAHDPGLTLSGPMLLTELALGS